MKGSAPARKPEANTSVEIYVYLFSGGVFRVVGVKSVKLTERDVLIESTGDRVTRIPRSQVYYCSDLPLSPAPPFW